MSADGPEKVVADVRLLGREAGSSKTSLLFAAIYVDNIEPVIKAQICLFLLNFIMQHIFGN